jgi:hypothetical protein
MVEFEGRRSGLLPGLEPGATRQYRMMVIAPGAPGEYILQVTVIQEGAFWFEDLHPGIVKEFFLSVKRGAQ